MTTTRSSADRHKAARGRPLRLLAAAGLVAALALVLAAAARADVAQTPPKRALYHDGPSERYLLDGAWYTRSDPGNAGLRSGFARAAGLAGWASATVPSAANAGDLSDRSYFGVVQWYRKDFLAPRTAATHWFLRFESVNYRATVWLNGKLLGSHAGAYLPFELETKGLRRRGVNRLVVRVDGRRGPLDVPPLAVRSDNRIVGGWWNYTGILREVYLRPVDTLDLEDVFVRSVLRCRTCAATVKIDARVRNVDDVARTAAVVGRIDGRPLALGTRRLRARGAAVVRGRLVLPKPRLWSPASPELYTLALAVRGAGGNVLQRYSVRFGVRDLRVNRSGRLLLNFQPVVLRGASMHEDDPVRGAALEPADLRRNIDLLRTLGANMTRSHYPLHPLALELADRYGIVVWSEIPVYQMQDRLFRTSRVRRQGLYILHKMIRRDRNHPSVIVWSVGNENTSRPGAGFRRYVRAARHVAHALDPTRLVGLAFPGYPTVGRQPLYAGLDALGVNDYFGWYDGPGGSIADRAAVSGYLDRVHHDYPHQALFVTEFGAEANRSGPAGEKGTFEFQSDFLAYHLGVFASKPYLNGALVWILRDFRVKPGYVGGNPHPQPPLNQKGLIDDQGNPKPAFEVVRRLFHPLTGAGAGG